MWSDPRTWTAGEVVTASMVNLHVRDAFRMLYREVQVVGAQSGSNGTSLNVGNGTAIVTFGAHTFKGVPVRIETSVQKHDSSGYLGLHEGAVGVNANTGHYFTDAAGGQTSGLHSVRFTPSAGAHTYTIVLWTGSVWTHHSVIWERGGV